MSTPTLLYRADDRSTARAVSAARYFFPIPPIEDESAPGAGDQCYGIEQDFEIAQTSFKALAKNTVHPVDTTCFLQDEAVTSDKGAQVLRWTRRYYRVPRSWDDWENISYTFPAFPGYLVLPSGATTPIGRGPQTPPNGVKCRVHYDYFMVGTGQTYQTEGDIPDIAEQTYVGAANPTFRQDPPLVADNIGGLGGTLVGTSLYLQTVPDKTTYSAWVANAAANGWAAGRVGTTDANPGQIVISCKPQRVMGNLWARVTKYVLAQ